MSALVLPGWQIDFSGLKREICDVLQRGFCPPTLFAPTHVQRICEDVRAYCSTSVMLTISVVRKIFNCIAFAGRSG
jgi:hypothetical protein